MAVRHERLRRVDAPERDLDVMVEHLEWHVHRTLDVALARVARIASLPRELLRRAHVQKRHRALVEKEGELVPRQSRTWCRNRRPSSLNSAGRSSGDRWPTPESSA